jgi:hypothetical protein
LHETDLFVPSKTESWQIRNNFSVFFVLYSNIKTQVKRYFFLTKKQAKDICIAGGPHSRGWHLSLGFQSVLYVDVHLVCIDYYQLDCPDQKMEIGFILGHHLRSTTIQDQRLTFAIFSISSFLISLPSNGLKNSKSHQKVVSLLFYLIEGNIYILYNEDGVQKKLSMATHYLEVPELGGSTEGDDGTGYPHPNQTFQVVGRVEILL